MAGVLRQHLATSKCVFFDNAPDMVAWLCEHLSEVSAISLDHDLGPNRKREGCCFDPGTGRDVADYLATRQAQCPVIIATTNSMARPGMAMSLEDAGWRCQSVVPCDDLWWIEAAWIPAIIGAFGNLGNPTTNNPRQTTNNGN